MNCNTRRSTDGEMTVPIITSETTRKCETSGPTTTTRTMERARSCPNVTVFDKSGLKRCHSWNGSSSYESEEMAMFFLELDERDGNDRNTTAPTKSGVRYTRYMKKAGVAVVGGTMVGAGIIMIPLPGPGIVVIGAGVSVLATEFPAAQRAMENAKVYCANVIGKGGRQGGNKNNDAANTKGDEPTVTGETVPDEEGATRSTSSRGTSAADRQHESNSEFEHRFRAVGQIIEETVYKGSTKAYKETKKIYKKSKKIGQKLESLATKRVFK